MYDDTASEEFNEDMGGVYDSRTVSHKAMNLSLLLPKFPFKRNLSQGGLLYSFMHIIYPMRQ